MLILTPTDFSLSPPTPTSVLDWVSSPNGQQAGEHGSSAASLLPADDDVVLVLPPRAVSWHRIALPKVAGGRLRAALDGLLEDRLLDDTPELHFALEPGGKPGQTLWVAACGKTWLKAWLQVLEGAGRPVARIVPAAWPLGAGQAPSAEHWAHAQGGRAWLVSATAQGVATLPLPTEGSMGVSDSAEDARWLTEPSVAAQAEHALDRRLELLPLHLRLLRAAQGGWNLAQFDLSLSGNARRGQRLKQALRQFVSAPEWRPARWGLAVLLLSLLGGINALAWMERNSLAAKKTAVSQVLQKTFPEVTLVLDAPAQMRRALVQLQQSSGVLSTEDLEAMLAATAAVAPEASPGNIDFSAGDARLGTWTVPEDRLQTLMQALNARGWQTSLDGGTLRIRPKAP
ncbi:type II secretion system protein GspL [Hydrogenophaga sp. MI9]|uniref:type II secretion system protein GspL n=1 Tax=Hydrogenophaga sp. MI9 TaxID=3453719 RepID=UPI003EED46A3